MLLLYNINTSTKRTPCMRILMCDATYTRFASKSPHPCLWHQTRAQCKWPVMENLGVWASISDYLRPRFALCPVSKFTWVTHSQSLLRCFVYSNMQSKCHMQICTHIFIKISDCKMSQVRHMKINWMTHSNISQRSLSGSDLCHPISVSDFNHLHDDMKMMAAGGLVSTWANLCLDNIDAFQVLLRGPETKWAAWAKMPLRQFVCYLSYLRKRYSNETLVFLCNSL